MNVYLSSRFAVDKKIEAAWIKRTGCNNRCYSFAFLNKAKPIPGYYNERVEQSLAACLDAGIQIMMDSGAFSIHALDRKRAKYPSAKLPDTMAVRELMFGSYTKYLLANPNKFTFTVTLDFIKDQEFIYNMQQRFHKLGLRPNPVFHGDDPLDWLQKHKDDGHDYICLGGSPAHKDSGDYYLNRVFEIGAKLNLKLHGLAMTSMEVIRKYPFHSVDSSTWSRTAAFGMILVPDVRRNRFLNLHVSNRSSNSASGTGSHHSMSKSQRGQIKELLAFHGFCIDEMGGDKGEKERHDWNGYVMSNLHKFDVLPAPPKKWKNLLEK